METPLSTGVYQHYKGGYYQLIGVAEHTETNEKMVVYVSLAVLPGSRLRVRPLKMFQELLAWPDGGHRPRFDYVGYEI